MTTYYAVGTGNWSGSSNVWATSSGGVAALTTPTSTDDVVFDVHSTGTVTIAGTTGSPDNCQNFTMTSPGAGTISLAGGKQLNVSASFTAASGMTFAPSAGAVINMTSTSAGNTWTSASYSYAGVTFNGVGGGWTLQDTFTGVSNGGIITLTNGSLSTNGQTINTCAFSSSNSNTRSLTLGSTTWNLNRTAAALVQWDISTSTGMTLSAASSTITWGSVNSGQTFNGGGLTYGIFQSTASAGAQFIISGNNSFGTLTLSISGNSVKTNIIGYSITGNQTVSGTFTAAGGGTIGRNFIYSGTVGTQYTISASTVSVTSTDFRDIAGAGTGSWNFSGLTTTANGDCGGNSGMTFTAPKNCYLKTGGVSVNWGDGNWETTSGGSTPIVPPIPLPQDVAIIDANSFTTGSLVLTQNFPRIPTVNFTGILHTPTLAGSVVSECYGSITLVSGMSVTNSGDIYLMGRSISNTIGAAGLSLTNNIFMYAPTGVYTLAANLTTSGKYNPRSGTINMGASALTVGSLDTTSTANGSIGSLTFNNGAITTAAGNTAFTFGF